MFALEGMVLAIAGITIGVGLAMSLTGLIRGFLFGVKPWDLTTFVSVPVLVSATALLAVWLPARRATRANLADTMRCE
jgi:ABC-type antimicrobial peptide transport system permease subunit